jgi:hypothetical protein
MFSLTFYYSYISMFLITVVCNNSAHPVRSIRGQPDLSHVRAFGFLTSRVSDDRPATLDRHTFHGVLFGFTVTDLNVRYYDLTSGRIKTAHNVVFEEVHYMWTRLIQIHHLRRRYRLVVERCDSQAMHVGSQRGTIQCCHLFRIDFLWNPPQAKLDYFLARLSEWSGQSVSEWVGFRNSITQAWVKAAAAVHPE